MKTRLGVILFGIGVFAVVIAAGLAFFVAPSVARLPYDLKLCTETVKEDCLRPSVAEAQNAQFLYTKGGDAPVVGIKAGTLQSTTEISPLPDTTDKELTGDLKGEAVVWRGLGTVVWTEKNETISQYEALIAVDRDTASAVEWNGQKLNDVAAPAVPAPVSYTGQLYKFPFGTERKNYEYFDRDLRKALPIEFKDTEKIDGLEVYRFEQVIPETALNFSQERIASLIGAFAKTATSGEVRYSNTRTIWVEPVTGNFIKVSERQRKTFVPNVGAPTQLLNGDFVYTPGTVSHNVASAGDSKSQIQLISLWLPIGVAVLGAILLIAGPWMVATGRKAARGRHEEITDENDVSEDENGKVTA
ncbi:DUF3068 domain-containing protein [Couchioplanes caeruleus]|uniref:DUF3068 family protein n=2 Tax=Couchioplanes caeruleus TaxID=56438 RepID=A0A1K0G6R8_9ACTN|nr:DUF3068 domain-containing protein [Couchioplanes caeruleus]OJF12954.1 hypothetical protein BG844_17850 [Couchioplanes caeruleus subsp. caeruleus]ROP33658.1 DUF3068 family protein [Couchioplanes caeruleus]